MTNGIKIIVSSIYELYYEPERSGSFYKSNALLSETLDAQIFENYYYVIYTDKITSQKYDLESKYKKPNIKLVYKELNSDFYVNQINPIREERFRNGEIYDRIYSVKNYIEVILNKIENLIEVSQSNFFNLPIDSVIWLDSGLFGTSCDNSWRDYIKSVIYGKPIFLDKIFEKIDEFDFLACKGNQIVINYEVRERIKNLFGFDIDLTPGCLFGGKQYVVKNHLSDYKNIFLKFIQTHRQLISEQEVLSIVLKNKKLKYFEFDDWSDLQKAVLQIIDFYVESDYKTTKCYSYPHMEVKQIEPKEYYTDREILNKILSFSNYELDNLDLSHFDNTINRMSTFAQYFKYPSGREHYRLLSHISKLFRNELLFDIGSNNGCSAIAISDNVENKVLSYDVHFFEETQLIQRENITFYVADVLDTPEVLKKTRFIILDTDHDGKFENIFYDHLIETNYKGLLFLDDIKLNNPMISFWNSINKEKYDVSHIGHNTGSGIVIFE